VSWCHLDRKLDAAADQQKSCSSPRTGWEREIASDDRTNVSQE
jgi:hypothetical protein